ncbi:MAG TPA: hypothetical protein VKZ81_33450 [Pseudonocardia sp.]|uniref:hypothetical protein n=1 Tax=Pseudonocardia sp. TaxID=60912 RepID=UPI002B4AB51F|nr:hypothetical protein [Pseudonocardia sp.]HLU60391.1 hypothetical protein [Pseudonocardia sp.]
MTAAMDGAAAGTVGAPLRTTRIAPSGARVALTVPEVFGPLRWYASTRFTGPRTARQFFLAPRGQYRLIPRHVLPGARERRVPLRGADAVVYEAADRSDAALVLVGPHHEATTWFGGPAPTEDGLAALLETFRFTDDAAGATLVPASDLLLRQAGVSVIGRGERATLVARPAVEALPTLPDWAGLRLPAGELWRADRVLDAAGAALAGGTIHEWRYLLAGPSAAIDLVLHGPESGRPPLALTEDQLLDALAALGAEWEG